MLPLLGIFTAISSAFDLFTKGKEIFNEVTESSSTATRSEELITEVSQLPEDKQQLFVDKMRVEIDQYKAQTERLKLDNGEISDAFIAKLDLETANKIAVYRMSTRPWAVRMSMHYLMAPMYLVGLDAAQHVLASWLPFLKHLGVQPFNTFQYIFGKVPATSTVSSMEMLQSMLLQPQTTLSAMYDAVAPYMVAIIVTYFGLRQYEKSGSSSTNVGSSISGALQAGISSVMNITNAMRGKK